jgi:hypothetical protein
VIESAKSAGDYSRAIRAARDTFPLMPAVVTQMKKEFGAFDIAPSHAVHTGASRIFVQVESTSAVTGQRKTVTYRK